MEDIELLLYMQSLPEYATHGEIVAKIKEGESWDHVTFLKKVGPSFSARLAELVEKKLLHRKHFSGATQYSLTPRAIDEINKVFGTIE